MSESAFIDTDILIKLGEFKGHSIIAKILLSFGYNLYIHEYLVNEELILGKSTIQQFSKMVSANEITVLKETDLSTEEKADYDFALKILANEMVVDITKVRAKNGGEIRSIAMAFAKDYEYFISDDKAAHVASKRYLQKIDGTCLKSIRMKDIIIHIKNRCDVLGINRKTAKQLYIYGGNPKKAINQSERACLLRIYEHLKKDFNEELWPLESGEKKI